MLYNIVEGEKLAGARLGSHIYIYRKKQNDNTSRKHFWLVRLCGAC